MKKIEPHMYVLNAETPNQSFLTWKSNRILIGNLYSPDLKG